MKFSIRKLGIAGLGLIGAATAPAMALAAEPDWKAVEQALGKAGQLQPGEVFRIGMPRSDLAVARVARAAIDCGVARTHVTDGAS